MDTYLQNEQRAGVEVDETNFRVVTVFAEDNGGGRKSSPNVHGKVRWK